MLLISFCARAIEISKINVMFICQRPPPPFSVTMTLSVKILVCRCPLTQTSVLAILLLCQTNALLTYCTERLANFWNGCQTLPSFEWTSSNYHCNLPDSAYRQQQALLDHQTWVPLKDTRSDNFLHSRTKNAII